MFRETGKTEDGARETGRYEEEKIVETVRWFRDESSRNIGHPGTRSSVVTPTDLLLRGSSREAT